MQWIPMSALKYKSLDAVILKSYLQLQRELFITDCVIPGISRETHLIPITRFAISTTDDLNQIVVEHGPTRGWTPSIHHEHTYTHNTTVRREYTDVHSRSCMRWYPFSQWFIEVETRDDASRWSVSKYNGQTVRWRPEGWMRNEGMIGFREETN